MKKIPRLPKGGLSMAMRPPTPPRMGLFPRNVGNPGLFGQGARGVSPFAGPPRVPASRGLLSQLFQRPGATQGAASMFSRAATGAGTETSLLQGLTNPQTITSFLGKTQNFLNTAQQFGPLIQQYGPLVRNLPAMWRIYQGLQSGSDDDEQESEKKVEETSDESSSEEESKNNDSSAKIENKKSSQSKQVRSPKKKKTGESVPKLYIN